jgi:heme/copper-type cytochrome/quinol oxidase subunit 2
MNYWYFPINFYIFTMEFNLTYIVMDTIRRRFLAGLVLLMTLFCALSAQAKSAAELAAEEKDYSLYGEIAIGILFVVALTLFIVWKSKHDRKEREKHVEQMRKVAANKRRAA